MIDVKKEILALNGWEVECESPFEIRHSDGSFATGQAAYMVFDTIESQFHPSKIVTIEYKNWKCEVGIRKILPSHLWFGKTEYHPEKQWLINAMDVDKRADRDFALNDIVKFIK